MMGWFGFLFYRGVVVWVICEFGLVYRFVDLFGWDCWVCGL